MRGRCTVPALAAALWMAAPACAEEPAVGDGDLQTRIERRISALPNQEGATVRVFVRDGEVLLQGSVRLLEQSLRIEQDVWKTPGVRDVDNELRVAPLPLGGDAEIERQIRLVLKGDSRFLDASLELQVEAGLVRLRGRFRDPSDVLAVKHRIAAIPGVLDIQIDALLVARSGAAPPRADAPPAA